MIKRASFWKIKFSTKYKKQFPVLFLWMLSFKTYPDLIGKFIWIGKMTLNFINLANTLSVKVYQPLHFKIIPPFLEIPYLPTLPANWLSQVFLMNRNTTLKLIAINTIHLKQQLNVGFFIFKFTLKCM